MQLLLQKREAHGIRRNNGFGVLDEVAELGIAILAQGCVQRNRLASVLLDLDDLLRSHVQFDCQLFRRGFTAQVLEHLTLHTRQLVDDLDHVDGNTNRTGLVRHGTSDGLTDPPGGIGRELVALGVVELLHRTDQAQVALLNEVQEEHAAPRVALGQRDHQAQVGL